MNPSDLPLAPPEPDRGRSISELLGSVSASRLSTWHQCRLKFYFRYVAGLRKGPTPSLHVGSTIHTVLQHWNLARWRKAPLDDASLKEIFLQAWALPEKGGAAQWEGDSEEDQAKRGAWASLETYFRETPIPVEERPEGVEVSVEADLSRHGLPKLVGILDLVREGGRIVDYKTTSRSPDGAMVAHTHETQLTSYAVLYREATDRNESEIALHHLVKTKVPKLVVTETGPATQNQIVRLFRSIESYTAGLEREDFVPTPGFHCASCEFFQECRAWR